MSNSNLNNNRISAPPRPSYPARPRGNGNGNGGQNAPGGYSYNDGYQYGYSPYYPRNTPSHHNPSGNPPAAQWRAHQSGKVYAMPVTRPANQPPPMDNQRQATRSGSDQPKESKPTSLDIDTMIQEESAKAKAKAAIDARKGNNSLTSADKASANSEETPRSQVRGSTFAPNGLPARVDSPMRFHANTTPSNLDFPPNKGPSVSASQPTIPAEGPTISGANSIPVGPSKDRRGSARSVDEAPSSRDQDIRDWLVLSGFHDVNFRNERLQYFRQMTAEERSVVPDIEQNRRSASRPQEVKEDSPDEVYMGKVRDLAKKMRGEFPPELLRELATTETPGESAPPENLYNRVTSKAVAREMAKEMARRVNTSNLPTLRRSPSPHLDRHNDQRRERSQDHGPYRDRREVHDRREQYSSHHHAYNQHDGRPSDSRRSRSPREHAEAYHARPPMQPSAEPELSSRRINSERRAGPWQEWKADYTRRRYE